MATPRISCVVLVSVSEGYWDDGVQHVYGFYSRAEAEDFQSGYAGERITVVRDIENPPGKPKESPRF